MSEPDYTLKITGHLIEESFPAVLSPDHAQDLAETLYMLARNLEQVKAATRTRVGRALDAALHGVYYRYPLCCVARYTFTQLTRPRQHQANVRGVMRPNPHHVWVACGVFHRPRREESS